MSVIRTASVLSASVTFSGVTFCATSTVQIEASRTHAILLDKSFVTVCAVTVGSANRAVRVKRFTVLTNTRHNNFIVRTIGARSKRTFLTTVMNITAFLAHAAVNNITLFTFSAGKRFTFEAMVNNITAVHRVVFAIEGDIGTVMIFIFTKNILNITRELVVRRCFSSFVCITHRLYCFRKYITTYSIPAIDEIANVMSGTTGNIIALNASFTISV